MLHLKYEVDYVGGLFASIDWVGGGHFEGYVYRQTLRFYEKGSLVTMKTKILDNSRYEQGTPVEEKQETGKYEETGNETITCYFGDWELRGKIIGDQHQYIAFSISHPNINYPVSECYERQGSFKAMLSANNSQKKIKLFLTDVDGVLTDAGMYYSESGDELKKFNTHDGKGIELLRNKGIKTGIITSEDTKIVSKRAKKLKFDYVHQGKDRNGKLAIAESICKQEGIDLDEVAYIGDDVNCFALLSNVGFSACPANALSKIKKIPGIIHLEKNGGEGAVREFVEYLLDNGLLA